MWRWIFPTLPLTCSAEIFLLPVGSTAIIHQRITPTMQTMNRDCDHETLNFSTQCYYYSTISFPFSPLPDGEGAGDGTQ